MRVRFIKKEDIRAGLELVWKYDYHSCECDEDSYRTIMSIDDGEEKAFFNNGLWDFFEGIIKSSYMIVEDKPTGIPTFNGKLGNTGLNLESEITRNTSEILNTGNDPLILLSESGTKHDNGKLKPTLLLDDMPLAINEILKVLQFGAEKYSEGNWLKVDNGINRYRNAADRHRLAIDEFDDESGLLHLAHEATSVLMLLELKLKEKRDGKIK